MLSLLLWSGLVWRVGTHFKVRLSTIKMLQGWSSRPGKKKNKCCRVFYRCPEINKKKEQQGDACCNSCVVMGCEDWHNCGWKCPHGAVAWWQRLFSCTFIHPLWRLVFVGFLYKKKKRFRDVDRGLLILHSLHFCCWHEFLSHWELTEMFHSGFF